MRRAMLTPEPIRTQRAVCDAVPIAPVPAELPRGIDLMRRGEAPWLAAALDDAFAPATVEQAPRAADGIQ